MALTKEGAAKIAAAKAGVTLSTYLSRRSSGMKWCSACKEWHSESAFGSDASRYDGLASACLESRRAYQRSRYRAKKRPGKGRQFVPPRDGDAKQARRRINYFVEAGILPHPNTLPCHDCGHTWKPRGRRHEYDHYLGYKAQHHECVQAVCSRCHHRRARRGKDNED